MVLTTILVIGFILYFFYSYGQKNSDLKPAYSNSSNDSDHTRQKRHYSKRIETLEKVILKMNKFNSESFSDRKFKLPLNEFTIMTNKQGLFKKTVDVGEKYINVSHLTVKQKDDILCRIEKAKEKIKI